MTMPIELPYETCAELLATREVGRVAVCTTDGPRIIPVNYSVVDDAVVFRTTPYSVLGMHAWRGRLAFEVDDLDPDHHAGLERRRHRSRHGRGGRRRAAAHPVRRRSHPLGRRSALAVRPAALGRPQWPPPRTRPHNGGVSPDPEAGRDPALTARTSALLDAVVAIGSDLDLHAVLDRIVRSACTLTGARYGALGVLAAGGGLGDFITFGLTDQQRAQIGDLPRGRGILGLLIAEPDPLRLPDLSAHPESVGFPPNHPPMSSFLGVPVRIRGTVFGNLYLTEKQGDDEFSPEDEVLVQALARAAGFVIENARSYEQSEPATALARGDRPALRHAAALDRRRRRPCAGRHRRPQRPGRRRHCRRRGCWSTTSFASQPSTAATRPGCKPWSRRAPTTSGRRSQMARSPRPPIGDDR